ncbi:hypothetical protein H5410_052581 [Solanum commersonii]|uniref:Uncharacterized protein n=1 Tax=Solanum commersonii TaxID=4109 RepID=A0A9J5X1W2_SOLCO|nr:hypothetical protein H5410_052581 [Solanum commersonii]
MTEAFKRLNAKVEALLQENTKLMEQIKSLKGKDSIQKINISTQTSEKSFPSLEKMDEQGVHSPTNAKRSTVSDNKDTASPDQTVAGKDTSNPFMAVQGFNLSSGIKVVQGFGIKTHSGIIICIGILSILII